MIHFIKEELSIYLSFLEFVREAYKDVKTSGHYSNELFNIYKKHLQFSSLFIKGIYGREMFETWHKMISMLQSGLDVSSVVTHQFKVDDFQEAFEVMRSAKSGKVILDWS